MPAPDSLPRNRRTGAFERRVAKALRPHLDEGARAIVACSGGPDSSAALVAAARVLGPERVVAAYFDHRWREDGAGEWRAVEALATRLGVHAVRGRAAAKPQNRAEAGARETRYRWLARACVAAGAPTCVTGHTLDDQAETVLLHLVRGAGLSGAAGMAAVSGWPVEAPRSKALVVLRPLLDVTRAEVSAYLEALEVEPLWDPSNESLEYARNRIRHRILPELRELNPRAAEQLAAFASRAREDGEALEALASAWLAEHGRASRGEVAIERRSLGALPRGLAARVVQQTGAALGVAVDAAGVEAVLRLAARRSGAVDLAGGGAEACGTMLVLRRKPRAPGRR